MSFRWRYRFRASNPNFVGFCKGSRTGPFWESKNDRRGLLQLSWVLENSPEPRPRRPEPCALNSRRSTLQARWSKFAPVPNWQCGYRVIYLGHPPPSAFPALAGQMAPCLHLGQREQWRRSFPRRASRRKLGICSRVPEFRQ